jgi:hypothetical protein
MCYQQRFEVHVAGLEDSLSVKIKCSARAPVDISSSPVQIAQVILDQQLDCAFGRSDHQVIDR